MRACRGPSPDHRKRAWRRRRLNSDLTELKKLGAVPSHEPSIRPAVMPASTLGDPKDQGRDRDAPEQAAAEQRGHHEMSPLCVGER
jgi:hypothetical protein